MSYLRFNGDLEDDKDFGYDHYNKFMNKVKKRLLKKQDKSEGSIIKKIKDRKFNDSNAGNLMIEVGKSSKNNEFTKMGYQTKTANIKVQPALPKWITNPIIIPINASEVTEEMPRFHDIITANLIANNIENFFPVQRKVIPWIIDQFNRSNSDYVPQDACVFAPTGSGKTLAYVLPIVQILLRLFMPRIRCLVVVPVQQLAIQVAKVFRAYTKGTSLKVAAIYGGKTSLKVEQEMIVKEVKDSGCCKRYETLVDIIVITPGKLVEHLHKTKGFDLSQLRFLIIDEADRMMENIQNNWLFYLQKYLNNEQISFLSLNRINEKTTYQKLLFSATLSTDPEKLEKLNLFQPVLFAAAKDSGDTVSKFIMPHELEEYYIIIESYLKPAVIAELITGNKWRRVLCFCKSAIEADRLSNLISQLCRDVTVRDISSKIPHRDHLINQFSIGEIDVLICTDIMGRGIDIPNVHYVISYDPPKYFKGYVHRAGRTGRAGNKGTVLTLLSKDQVSNFEQTMKSNFKCNISQMEICEKALEKKSKCMETVLESIYGKKGLEKTSSNNSNSNKPKSMKKRPKKKKRQSKKP